MSSFEASLRMAKRWTMSTLREKAAKDLQLCIRLEAAAQDTQTAIVNGEFCVVASGPGECVCVTCGAVHDYKRMHAGHFLSSRRNSILFDERGIHTQCNYCNSFLSGNAPAYRQFMLEEYGQQTIDDLERLRNQVSRTFTREELVRLRLEIRERIKRAK